jgi:nucleoside-diphosphate-sugar epimerase
LLTDINSPVSEYGKSKNEAEVYLLENRPTSWTSIIIRPPMVIGPRDTAVLDIFKMVKGGIIILPDVTSRKKEYSFVCVFDLIETIVLSLSHKQDAVFYSAYDSIITFEQLIFTIQKEMNKSYIFFLPLPSMLTQTAAQALAIINQYRPHHLRLTPDKIKELLPSAWTCDNSVTKIILGQNFQFSLEETVRMTYEDYKKNSHL